MEGEPAWCVKVHMATLEQICPFKEGVYAWQDLQILMCWPRDVEQQLQARRAFYLHNLGNAELKAASDTEYLQACMHYEPIRQELGGWIRMADAPAFSEVQKSIQERQNDGFIAGTILRLMHELHTQKVPLANGPSLNKTMEFLRIRGDEIFRQNRTFTKATLLGIWSEFKPVAHLWAAHLSLAHKHLPRVPDKDCLRDPAWDAFDRKLAQYLHRLYCMAKHLQEFGIAFKSKGTGSDKKCLLDPEASYLLGEVPKWREYVMPRFSIPADWLETFKAYQAPKAI